MKNIILLFALLISSILFGQKSFKASNGHEYKIGDTIVLKNPSLPNEEYKSLILGVNATRMRGQLEKYMFVINKIKVYKNAIYGNVGTFIGKFVGIKGIGSLHLVIDEAIKSDEIVTEQ